MRSAPTATSLIRANQNSASPKYLTATTFRTNSSSASTAAGSHFGTSGHQNWAYPVMAARSPMAATIQANQ